MNQEDEQRATSALSGVILQLFIRQVAILDLLQQQGIGEQAIRDAMTKATEQIHRVHMIATIRTQEPVQALELLDKTVLHLLFPK
jgi:hypothetical protein